MSDLKSLSVMSATVIALTIMVLAMIVVLDDAEPQINVGDKQSGGITVTGRGSVSATPDVAQIDIGIEVSAKTVADSRQRAARAMTAVMNVLDDEGVEETDIQTRSFSIYPRYSYPEGKPAVITGFVVNNQVTVKVRKIDNVSTVIDRATQAGGDMVRMNGISFIVDKQEQFLNEAREEAITDARKKAQVLADAAGIKLGNVRTINETTTFGGEARFGIAEAAFDTRAKSPISPGEQELTVNVSVVYEVK